ncbi:MAG: hypothetical protein AAF657_26145, partial [Acidobacteriota bacterium]
FQRVMPAEGAATALPARPARWQSLPGAGWLQQGGTALADQAVVSGTTLATSVLVGRTCSKEQFGLFMLAFSLLLLCNGLMISLISAPYVVRRPLLSHTTLARHDGDTLIYLAVLCGLVALGLLLATAADLGPAGLSPIIGILSGVVVVQLFKEYARQMCFARLQMGSALAMDSTVGALQVGGLLWLASTGRLTPSTAFAAIGVASGLAALAWCWHNHNTLRVCPRQAVRDFDQHWQLARFAFVSGLLHALTVNLYPWIVAWTGGIAAAGVWAAGFAIAALIVPPVTGAQNYLAPRLADAYAQGGLPVLRRLAVRASGAFCALALPYAASLALFGGLVVVFCYGDPYAGHEQLVAVLGAALLAGAAGFSFGRALFSIDRAQVDLLANAIALGILLTAGAWMTWQWGPLGAAYGMLLTNTVASLIKAMAFLWLSRSRPTEATR